MLDELSHGASSNETGKHLIREIETLIQQIVIVIVAAAMVAFGVGCRTPHERLPASIPGIEPSDVGLTRELHQLDAEIRVLDELIGRYPARFSSNQKRSDAHARWAAAVERSVVLLNVDLENPELFARAGNLYRYGHNLGVPEASASAYRILSRCIELAMDHIDCHYYLAQLLLASPSRFAASAERLLLRVRSFIAPQIRPEFESALARAYLAQGKRSAALQQIDRYLSLRPDDVAAQRFRDDLMGR